MLSVAATAGAFDYVGSYDWIEKFVTSGGSATVDSGFWTDGATLYKTGAGSLALPLFGIYGAGTVTACLADGTVTTVAASGEEPTTPTDVLNRATLWLDATEDRFSSVGETGDVSYWYDVRETKTDSTWSSAYWAAEARGTNDSIVSTAEVPIVYPTLDAETEPGKRMVYFHGFKSGSWMKLVPAGKHDGTQGKPGLEGLRHVFIVFKYARDVAYPLSTTRLTYTSKLVPFFHPGGIEKSKGTALFAANSARPETFAADIYLNGQRVKGTAALPDGLSVLNWNSTYRGSSVCFLADIGAFFNDRYLMSYQRHGGDWIGEVIAFRDALTEAERAAVEAYLLRKWTPHVGTGSIA